MKPLADLSPCLGHISRDVTLHPSDLVLEWYDLGRGVAHLGQDVAQLSQVLSFLVEVIVTLVAEVLLLSRCHPLPECHSVWLVRYALLLADVVALSGSPYRFAC